MKTIIAGSRTAICQQTLAAIHIATSQNGFQITEVVSGCATGPDTHGATWAANHKIPVKKPVERTPQKFKKPVTVQTRWNDSEKNDNGEREKRSERF